MTRGFTLAAGAAMAAIAAVPAEAASVSRLVTLTVLSPTYQAPADGTPPTALSDTIVPYDTFSFIVGESGTYQLSLSASGGFNPFLALYGGGFASASPLTNIIAAKNSPTGFGTGFGANLTAGTAYVAVLGGKLFAPAGGGGTGPGGISLYFGQFGMSGPGTITAIPEPSTWVMLIGGLGLAGGALRRRATRVRFA